MNRMHHQNNGAHLKTPKNRNCFSRWLLLLACSYVTGGQAQAPNFNYTSGSYNLYQNISASIAAPTQTGGAVTSGVGVSTLAGFGGAGLINGAALSSRFNAPSSAAVDAAGNIYIADMGNNAIRKIDAATGQVSVFAGTGSRGTADGTGTAASFSGPISVVADNTNNCLYVADQSSNLIRKVDLATTAVTTLAGIGNSSGYVDGAALSAKFNAPSDLGVDAQGNVYVADLQNHAIRKIDVATQQVSTFAGNGTSGNVDATGNSARLNQPRHLTLDAAGNVYFNNASSLRKVTPAGVVTTLIPSFYYYGGMSVNASGVLFIADRSGHTLRSVHLSTLQVSLVAGTASTAGGTNGAAASARFSQPFDVVFDAQGNAIIPDRDNNLIRKYDPVSGQVTTLAGVGGSGYTNGAGTTAAFNFPAGLTADAAGNVYVADSRNNVIRKIDAVTGQVSTYAGTGDWGNAEGAALSASFRSPSSVAMDAAGNLYVGDVSNYKIRKISAAGVVSTVAGGGYGSANGAALSASFIALSNIALNPAGTVLYIADGSNGIRKFDLTTNQVSSVGATASPAFGYTYDVDVDAAGNIYVSENARIRKIDGVSGAVTQLATAPNITGIELDGLGNLLLISEATIQRLNLTTLTLTTIAGSNAFGSENGAGVNATFYYPYDLALTAGGHLVIADRLNHIIRKVTNYGYHISPALPAGMSLNSNGSISGTPASVQPATSYTVTGTNASGSGSATFSIAVLLAQPPTITSFTPVQGNVATSVTITGTNFSSTASENVVFFGATRATVTAASATQLVVTVPAGATFGPITVQHTGTRMAVKSRIAFTPTFTNIKQSIGANDMQAYTNFAAGSYPYHTSIADLDGDGKSDLVVSNNAGINLSVLRNTSTSGSLASGSFAAAVSVTAAGSSGPSMTAVGDLDGDGLPDVVAASTYSFGVLRNTNTTGSIAAAGFNLYESYGASGNAVALADMDGDGRLDIILGGYQQVRVIRNLVTAPGNFSASSFASPVSIALPSSAQVRHMVVQDMDGDGKPDIVTANFNISSLSLIRNTATAGSLTSGSFATAVSLTVGLNPFGIAAGDLDGDGKPDLAINNGTGANAISLLRNVATPGVLGASSFEAAVHLPNTNNGQSLNLADMNGDGKPDLVCVNNTNVWVLRNATVSGSFTASSFAAPVSFGAGTNPYGVSSGDLDGDGKPDVVTANYATGNVSVLRNNPVPPPVVSSFFPALSAPGATIAISGTGFTGITAVRINGVAVQSFTVISTTQITAVVASGNTTGVVSVDNANGTGSTSGTITITSAPVLAYANNNYSLLLNNAITPIAAPQNTGGALPQGLAGQLSTLAGSGVAGAADNSNALAATFDGPISVAADPSGNIYVAEMSNHLIRKITPTGSVSTFAGTGTAGFTDNATGTQAQFNGPAYVATDRMGNVYVTDFYNHSIRKITPAGAVSTLAGTGSSGYADNATGSLAQFRYPIGIAVDVSGNVYVADKDNQRIRKITSEGSVSTIAGSGTIGYLDHATGTQAQFRYPISVAVAASGEVYVADQLNNRIRKITVSGAVTTVAGDGTPGNSNNSNGLLARFGQPRSLALDVMGNLYVADESYHNIRKVSTSGAVTTVAGNGSAGFADAGNPLQGQFNNPPGITVDGDGNLLVADFNNKRIRKVQLTGYAISPALPGGLTLNNNGTISGTPTAASPATNYTLTGTNQVGSSSVVANIVVLITPSIATSPNISKVYGNPAFTMTDPVSNSGGAFTYTSSNTGVATISGNTVTIVGVGNTIITASQAASGNYAAGSTTATLTVSAATPVISVVPTTPVVVTYGAVTQNLQPSSASAGAFTFSTSDGTVAAVSSSGVVSFGNVGTATITISQAAAGNYTAGSLTVPVTVSAATPVISVVANPVSVTFGASAQNLQATSASSGTYTYSSGTYTYSSSNTAVVTVDAQGGLSFTGAGNANISINQVAAGNYDIASLTVPVTVAQAAPSIGALSLPAATYGDPVRNLTNPASNSGSSFSYSSSNTNVATVNGNTLTIVGRGTTTITATQAATTNYTTGSVQAVLTVAPAAPQITQPAAMQKVMGSGSFQLVDPATNSNGVFSYVSSNSSVATIIGNTVTLTGLGQTTITATQAATANFNSGATTFVLTVVSSNPGLAGFSVDAKTFGDAPFALTAPTSQSNGAFSYTSSNASVATISGNTVIIVGAGNATITATQAAAGYYPAASISAVLTVAKANPVITAPALVNKVYGDAAFALTALQSSSNGVWSYASSNTSVAIVNGNIVTIAGAGSATITATQAATANYNAGATTISISIAKANPVVVTPAAINKVYGDATFSMATPSSNSSGVFTYIAANNAVATVNGNMITIAGAGSTTITATQAATANYNAGTTSISISVAKANPVVSTPAAIGKQYGDAAFALAAPQSNGSGAWSFTSSNTGVATISGNTVSIVGAGMATITFTQAADANYNAAQVSTTLAVGKAPLTIKVADAFRCVNTTNPVFTYNISGFVNREGAGVLQSLPVVQTAATQNSAAGTYAITASGAQAANYNITYVPGVLTVNNPQRSAQRYPVVDAIAGEATPLQARSFGTAYQWAPATGLGNSRTAMPSVTLQKEQQYTIGITEATGCVITDTVLVRTFSKPDVFVPNLFSPNGDGVNDELRINPVGMKQLYYFRIFDQYGKVLFETRNLNEGWNGRYRGELQTLGTYPYMLSGQDKNGKWITTSGSVTLVR